MFIDSSSSNKETTGLGDASIEVLHILLSYILDLPKEDNLLSEEQKELFLNSLRKDFPKERVPLVLSPLLYSKTHQQEDTPFVADLDFGCTLNLNKVIHKIVFYYFLPVFHCDKVLFYLTMFFELFFYFFGNFFNVLIF